jgi:dTDP-glucose 4,6-dehydratase
MFPFESEVLGSESISSILVTGGGGFFASNLEEYVKHQNLEAYHVDSVSREDGDLRKAAAVEHIWHDRKPSHVINLASRTYLNDSVKDPKGYWNDNLSLMLNVLEACRKHDCRLLHLSSAEVYGTAVSLPMDENHPLQPQSPYALTKCIQDRACYAWWKTYGLRVSILRPFNQFGPFQGPERAIPRFIQALLRDEPMPVYGDGQLRRDYLYVKDTVRGIWLALLKLPSGEVANLATGKSHSILEVCSQLTKAFREVTGRHSKSQVKFMDSNETQGHVEVSEGSYVKAKQTMGWEPEYQFSDALLETIQWVVQNNHYND